MGIFMKAFIFLLTLLTVHSANAHTYRCEELTPSKHSKGKVFVRVSELEEVTKKHSEGQDFDNIYRVQVDIKQISGRVVRFTRTVYSYAKVLDVEYQINATKDGVRFHLYLDEEDEAGIVFTDGDGQKRKVNLKCR